MSIRIFGASDDLVEIDGHVRIEEDTHNHQDGMVLIEVGDEVHGGLAVGATHTPRHGWSIHTGLMHVEHTIPWPVTLRTKTDDDPDWYPDYSPILEIDCPEDERVEVVS